VQVVLVKRALPLREKRHPLTRYEEEKVRNYANAASDWTALGKVMTKLKLMSMFDKLKVLEGDLDPTHVRSVEVDALVDTGAVSLALPEDIVSALGLHEIDRRSFRLADNTIRELPIMGGLYIEILGRRMQCDAVLLPAGATPLIGQIPLEGLDLVVDPRSGDAAVNPASPDFPIIDLLRLGGPEIQAVL
jgi:clan AA aspartic protease